VTDLFIVFAPSCAVRSDETGSRSIASVACF
jgi:hypothetical protein